MTDTTSDPMAPVWVSLRIVLLAIGGILADEGFQNSGAYKWIMIGAGAVSIVGPAVWGLWVAINDATHKRVSQAKAVQAGLNLAASGQMLDSEGKPVTSLIGGTPPLPVTLTSAAQIVKDFAPAEAPKVS